MAAPTGARAYRTWESQKRSTMIAAARRALASGQDAIDPSVLRELAAEAQNEKGDRRRENDDPQLRALMNDLQWGPRSPQVSAALLQEMHAEALKMRAASAVSPMARSAGSAALTTPGAVYWNNIGPQSARSEWNGSYYSANDSGRPTAIRVDPTNPNNVFLATSGGGVWAANNFLSSTPNWTPLTDGLGALAIGAMDIRVVDATHTTLWLGLGDAFDQKGGQLVSSTDSGTTWSAPLTLPAVGGFAVSNVRDLRIDPNNANIILVATDVGLFRSTNAGASFANVALPKSAGYTGALEATWNFGYLGVSGATSAWVVSGLYACPGAPAKHPPGAGGSALSCGAGTGNLGDIWTSADAGATWTSLRAAGKLPALPADATPTGSTHPMDYGRIYIAAATTGAPATAAIYAMAGGVDEGNPTTMGLFGSRDGGQTWALYAAPTSPTQGGTLDNPTAGGANADCGDLNVAHGQAWYNLVVGVDPTNFDHALIGGNLCGVRTIDGGKHWQNVAHWLPTGGGGSTANGLLPYVHADWHAMTSTVVAGKPMMVVGSDGGLFTSVDVFSQTPELVDWQQPDVGLATHLCYSVGSGDLTRADPRVVFTGLQDNGTRWRLVDDFTQIYSIFPQTFDQVIGGDGVGVAVTYDAANNPFYWGTTPGGGRYMCRGSAKDCGRATTVVAGVEVPNWAYLPPPGGDADPFIMLYAPISDAGGAVLTATQSNVFKLTPKASGDAATYTPLTAGANTLGQVAVRSLSVSPFTYSINGIPSRLYGAAISGGAAAIIVDGGGTSAVSVSATPMGINGQSLRYASSVAFPSKASNFGSADGQTYVLASAAPVDSSGLPVQATTGHIFLTVNGGGGWAGLSGTGAGALPNVPVYVVRFDPSDPTDSILYAGTEAGLYRSTDRGQSWARYGAGLPMVRVTDLAVSQNGGLLRVATYGRGVWEVYPHAEANSAVGNGDFDRNGVIDFMDVAASASRINLTPPTSAPNYNLPYLPSYDATLDLGGTAGKVDESDLSAVLAKFGSAQ